MWGRLGEREVTETQRGNTPTHVGKTLCIKFCLLCFWKHPHACGEDSTPQQPTKNVLETPPRMWGRLSRLRFSASAFGNTPTHVGKTADMLTKEQLD